MTRSPARWMLAGTGLVVAALLVVLLTSGTDRVPKKEIALPLRRVFVASRSGIAVRYPVGWQVATHNDTAVPNPALCFTLQAPRGAASHRATLKLVEYLPPELDRKDLRRHDAVTGDPLYPYRVEHVRLTMFQPADNSWTRGSTLDFQDHGRVFYVGIVLPAAASQRTRRSVEAIIDTIRVRNSGRCRPTSGVGSVRYYRRLARHRPRALQAK